MVFSLAGWLPWLWSTSSGDYPYPRAYEYYLWLYQAALAALVGFQAWVAGSGRAPTWWPVGEWSRPLVAAPALLIIRALLMGHWAPPLAGLLLGLMIGAARPWRRGTNTLRARWWAAAPWLVFAFSAALAFGSGMRIYEQTGARFPLGSDDGDLYYNGAQRVAEDPRWFWTSSEADPNFVSFYYFIIGLWFRLIGHPHLPSWLAWQGLAAGCLALTVYWFGSRLGSRMTGLVAAGFVAADHVMLHLMGTLNMEVLSIPSLYVGLWLWVDAQDAPASRRLNRCAAAGLWLGLSTLFRPTAGLIPLLLIGLLMWERPKLSWSQIRVQGSRLLAGFALPMLIMIVRNRFLWGHWTLGQSRGSRLSWLANYAWDIQGQHPATIGLGPWLKLVAADPSVIWREMMPNWWNQILFLWTHYGFGQMDLIQGLNHLGRYQAALAVMLTAAVIAGIVCALRRRSRGDLVTLALPVYFTALAFVWYVINTRYRSPFIPALYLLACLGFQSAMTAIRARGPVAPGRGVPSAAPPSEVSLTSVAANG